MTQNLQFECAFMSEEEYLQSQLTSEFWLNSDN